MPKIHRSALIFIIKQRLKVLGIILIALGVIVFVASGNFGIVGFVLLVVAGVLAIRDKPKPMELTNEMKIKTKLKTCCFILKIMSIEKNGTLYPI